jgi:hypothetical protein
MPIHSDLPSKQIPAKRAIDIIRKASGMSVDGIKKNLRQFNSGEIRKISHNVKKNFITQKEMRSLLRKAEQSGMKISSSKISMAYNQINREEKKRKVQYGKERDRMVDNLTSVEKGQLGYKQRDASGNIRSNSRRGGLDKKTDRGQTNTNSGLGSSPANSWGTNNEKKKDDDEDKKSTTVVELPI